MIIYIFLNAMKNIMYLNRYNFFIKLFGQISYKYKIYLFLENYFLKDVGPYTHNLFNIKDYIIMIFLLSIYMKFVRN